MDRRGFLKGTSLVTSFYFLSGLAHQATRGGKAFAITKDGAALPLGSWTSNLINEWAALPARTPSTLWKVYPESTRDQNNQELRAFAFEFRRQIQIIPETGPQRREKLKEMSEIAKKRISGVVDISDQDPRLMQAASLFMHQALDFDSSISGADVYQALRNVITALFLQQTFQVTTVLTPSITAYSLLYPYTDNYLDETLKSTKEKVSFAERFRRRLSGESVKALNSQEYKIFSLVEFIENEYDRLAYPEVYKALLLIHDRQIQSLARQQQKDLSKFSTAEVLDMSIQKGGASVLADAILVHPSAKETDLQFAYRLGFVLQLIDDLQDTVQDYLNGDVTIFTQALSRQESLEPIILKVMQAVEATPVENKLFKQFCYYLIAEGAMNLKHLPAVYPGMGRREYEQRLKKLELEMPRRLRSRFLQDLGSRFEVSVARLDEERIERLFAAEFDKSPRKFASQLQEALEVQ